jgi:Tol biopolymer transport system component
VSPDGKWVAFTELVDGASRIFVRAAQSSHAIALTGGYCNSSAPAWNLDSSGIVFASDCGRGIGLPSLYRAQLKFPELGQAASR